MLLQRTAYQYDLSSGSVKTSLSFGTANAVAIARAASSCIVGHRKSSPQDAGATRIEYHCGTRGDRGTADFVFRFTSTHSSANSAPTFPVQQASLFLPFHFSGHCFRRILASSSFACSVPGSALTPLGPSHKAAARFGSRSPRFWVPQKNGAEKGDIFMSYLYVRWNSFGLRLARRRF